MADDRNNIELFNSLFRGRNDLYAVRWEKDGKSGYMPAYEIDWSNYQKHKAQAGSFKDYKDKKLLPFDHLAIEKHLSGKETCGIYPLQEDNTSFFIAVDFDKENWKETIRRLHNTCSDFNLPSYIEKSRSGNGGHLWIFFEEAFSAEHSRKIMFEMLRNAGIISHFEKEPSFDRLFPNQDFHSGKGFGNLIALPLNGRSLKEGNTCFIDPKTFESYKNQWDFLLKVKKVSNEQLKELYEKLFNIAPSEILGSINTDAAPELEIIIFRAAFK